MAPPKPKLEDIQRGIALSGETGSFYEFVKMAWHIVEPGVPFVNNWHVEEVCAHLEATYYGKIRKLCICIPPGCMKSLLTSVFFPVWCWLRSPALRFAFVSYDASLTGMRDGGKCLSLIQDPWFTARFGDRVMVPADAAASVFHTSASGVRFGTSIEGKLTGRHNHFLVVDDPLKPQGISKASLDNVKRWRSETAPTRLLPPQEGEPGAEIYIMQRLHEDDPVGLAERESGWVILRLPMRFDEKDPCVTPIGGDRRTVHGELLWPKRFDAATVASREERMGPRTTAAQHDQRPTPDGGLVFKADTFKTFDVAPSKFDEILQSWDFTFKDAETSDFVCGQVWGRLGASFYLLDMVHAKLSFTGSLEAIRALTRKWPKARRKLVEDKANGTAIMNTLQKEISGLQAVNPEGGKEARANAVEPYFSAGNVYHPNPAGCVLQPEKSLEPETCPWVDVHRKELMGFPFAAHDDTVDACTQALVWFRAKQSRFSEAMAKLREQGVGLRLGR